MSLPNSFQVYRAPQSSWWSKTKIYHIGTIDTPPLYTCKETVSWSGKFTIDLHSGPTADGASVASSASGSSAQKKAVITIPQSDSQTGGEISEPFRRHASLKHETWDFVVAIVTGNERHAERFEWRRSHGDETASLRGGKSTYGWKLIRLQSGASVGADLQEDSRVLGESSDGKEVVAVWSDDTQTWFRGAEKRVVGKFEFIGSGAVTGDGGLGEEWKLFAALSAMHMRQVNLQHAQAAGTTAAAAGAG